MRKETHRELAGRMRGSPPADPDRPGPDRPPCPVRSRVGALESEQPARPGRGRSWRRPSPRPSARRRPLPRSRSASGRSAAETERQPTNGPPDGSTEADKAARLVRERTARDRTAPAGDPRAHRQAREELVDHHRRRPAPMPTGSARRPASMLERARAEVAALASRRAGHHHPARPPLRRDRRPLGARPSGCACLRDTRRRFHRPAHHRPPADPRPLSPPPAPILTPPPTKNGPTMSDTSSFRSVLRGYDPAQVDQWRAEHAGALDQARQEAAERTVEVSELRAALARAQEEQSGTARRWPASRTSTTTAAAPTYANLGERIGTILGARRRGGRRDPRDAQADAAPSRAPPRLEADRVRAEADRYAEDVRTKADAEATQVVEKAKQHADAILDDADREACARREEAEAFYEHQRARAASAAADFEATLGQRRDKAAAEFCGPDGSPRERADPGTGTRRDPLRGERGGPRRRPRPRASVPSRQQRPRPSSWSARRGSRPSGSVGTPSASCGGDRTTRQHHRTAEQRPPDAADPRRWRHRGGLRRPDDGPAPSRSPLRGRGCRRLDAEDDDEATDEDAIDQPQRPATRWATAMSRGGRQRRRGRRRGRRAPNAQAETNARALAPESTLMSLLVLGGTAWLGREVVAAARTLGQDVTVLARGESGAPPPDVEVVLADRGEPAAYDDVRGRAWDVVVDVARQPSHVTSALEALGPAPPRGCSCPPRRSMPRTTSREPTSRPSCCPPTRRTTTGWETYGGRKVACERSILDHVGEKALVARSRTDRRARATTPTARATGRCGSRTRRTPTARSWCRTAPVATQVLDVRDLAAWLVRAGLDRARASSTRAVR